jgi:SAM-dependent methyltransferase
VTAGPCPACAAPLPARPALSSPDRVHGTTGRVGVVVCERCGTGMTLPRVAAAELERFYPADYAPYDEPPPGLLRVISTAIRAAQGALAWRGGALDAARVLPPGRALDVGCGRGDLAAALVRRGWRADGIDPSETACELARARGVNARPGTLETLELERGAYDFALFHHSLEHTDDPARDLAAVSAALRPGGTLVVVAPNFGGWQARRFRGRWYHLDLPRHRTHFTMRGLRTALERAGLRVTEQRTTSTSAGLPGSLQYRVAGRCLFPSGLGLRVALGLCLLDLHLVRGLDRMLGAGDVLHVVARRADGRARDG